MKSDRYQDSPRQVGVRAQRFWHESLGDLRRIIERVSRRRASRRAQMLAEQETERLWFWRLVKLEVERTRRGNHAFSVLCVRDLDQPVLAELAHRLRPLLRDIDAVLAERDRLLILLGETSGDDARAAMRRLTNDSGLLPHDANFQEVSFPARRAHVRSADRVSARPGRGRAAAACRMTGMLTGRRYDPLKRLLDITVSAASLPIVLPVLGACAFAIAVNSRGPILFRQQRTGRDGRPFAMYKFRTMVQNADELKKSLQHLSVVPYPDFKLVDDPRITRVGRFLRKTSLDELPQIWNILRGDMSLVGPRPTSFAPETYDLWHARRLEVRPGLTGLWQITGRNTTDFDQRSRLDDQYIRSRSLRVDLGILLRTIPEMLRQRGL